MPSGQENILEECVQKKRNHQLLFGHITKHNEPSMDPLKVTTFADDTQQMLFKTFRPMQLRSANPGGAGSEFPLLLLFFLLSAINIGAIQSIRLFKCTIIKQHAH